MSASWSLVLTNSTEMVSFSKNSRMK
uniref:Uncharacterized protein n=1 Tax=Arundo donax TaxID=35708 RepID=A0A0A9C8W2_ARUDO